MYTIQKDLQLKALSAWSLPSTATTTTRSAISVRCVSQNAPKLNELYYGQDSTLGQVRSDL